MAHAPVTFDFKNSLKGNSFKPICFQKLISTHISATHMSPLPVQTSIYTTRWVIIYASKKAVSILKLPFIFTAPYQVTTNLLQVVS